MTDEQNGFRKNRGTTDGIYTIKRVQQVTHKKQQPLFLLFVDLTAAFDHVPRKWLFDSIRLRFPTEHNLRLFDILESLYRNTSLTYDEANVTFKTSSGVRQGGPESPCLFMLYADFVMRLFMEKCHSEENLNFYSHTYRLNCRTFLREERLKMRHQELKSWGVDSLPWSGYADDLVLFLLDCTSLQRAVILLDQIFRKYGLTINATKTETMVINWNISEGVE